METRLIVLKLVLDELGIPILAQNEDEVQEAIGNMAKGGLNFGYTFGYRGDKCISDSLVTDYDLMMESLMIGDRDYNKYELQQGTKDAIKATQNKKNLIPIIVEQRNPLENDLTKLPYQFAIIYWQKDDGDPHADAINEATWRELTNFQSIVDSNCTIFIATHIGARDLMTEEVVKFLYEMHEKGEIDELYYEEEIDNVHVDIYTQKDKIEEAE